MTELSPEALEAIKQLGSIGGKKAAENMTPEQRKDRASKAVRAREEKRRKAKEEAGQ